MDLSDSVDIRCLLHITVSTLLFQCLFLGKEELIHEGQGQVPEQVPGQLIQLMLIELE